MKKLKRSFILGSVFSLFFGGTVWAHGGPGDDEQPPPEQCPGGVVVLGQCITFEK